MASPSSIKIKGEPWDGDDVERVIVRDNGRESIDSTEDSKQE